MNRTIPAPPVSAEGIQDLLRHPRLREILESNDLQRSALCKDSVSSSFVLSNALVLPIAGPVGGGVAVVEVQDFLCLPLTLVDDRWLVCAAYFSSHIGAPAPRVDTTENFNIAYNRFSRGPSMALLQVLAEHGRGAVRRLRASHGPPKRKRTSIDAPGRAHRKSAVRRGDDAFGEGAQKSTPEPAYGTPEPAYGTIPVGESLGFDGASDSQFEAAPSHLAATREAWPVRSRTERVVGSGDNARVVQGDDQTSDASGLGALPHGCTSWTSVVGIESILQDLDRFEDDMVRPYRDFAAADCIVSHAVFDLEKLSNVVPSAPMYIVGLYDRRPDDRVPDPNRDGFCVVFCHETNDPRSRKPNGAVQFLYNDLPLGKLPDPTSSCFFRADFTDTNDIVREQERQWMSSVDADGATDICAGLSSGSSDGTQAKTLEVFKKSSGRSNGLLNAARAPTPHEAFALQGLCRPSLPDFLARTGEISGVSTDGIVQFMTAFHKGRFDLNLDGFMNVPDVLDMPHFKMVGVRECLWGKSDSPVASLLTTCLLEHNGYGAGIPRYVMGVFPSPKVSEDPVSLFLDADLKSGEQDENDIPYESDGEGDDSVDDLQENAGGGRSRDAGPHVCVECHKEMRTLVDLECHYGKMHYDKRLVLCTDCPKQFRNRSNRERHFKTVHKNERKFKCSYDGCNRAFSQRSDLQRHHNGRHDRAR